MLKNLIEIEPAETETREKRNYNGIDLVKFICAIMVFIIRIPPFGAERNPFAADANFILQQYVCRLAVPFFFVSSGFFLFRKIKIANPDFSIVKKYCSKLLLLLGLWHILLASGDTFHLWYIGATVVAVLILYGCIKCGMKFNHILLFALMMYVPGLLGMSYYGLTEILKNNEIIGFFIDGYEFFFNHTRNGIFMGFVFVTIGAAFAFHKIRIKLFAAVTGFVVSMVCMFAEAFLLENNSFARDYNMYVFLLPATFFLFYISCNITLKDSAIYGYLRSIGVLIYFLHMFVNRAAVLGISIINKYCGLDLYNIRFLISLAATCGIAWFITWLSRKEKFSWMKILYS